MSQNTGAPEDATAWRARQEAVRRDSQEQREQREEQEQQARERARQTPPASGGDSLVGEEGQERRRGLFGSVLAGIRELVIVIVLAMALSFVVKTWLFQA
ncbi:MAG: hypothetical protein ABI692_15350, partial [Terracoccus sp.]